MTAPADSPITNKSDGNAQLRSRYRGALLGLAVGDALGTTLEFKTPGTFEPVSTPIPNVPFSPI